MMAGFTSPVGSRTRRRKAYLPASLTVLDAVSLFLLALLPVGSIWILGGNRLWIMGPMILVVILATLSATYRFLVSPYRRDLAIPPGGWFALALLAYLAVLAPFAQVPYEALMETARFLSYLLAFWLWTNLLRVNHRWKLFLSLLLLSASLMAWYALIQDVHGTRRVLHLVRPDQYGMRASGAYICPNHFAHLMHMVVLAGVGLALCRRVGLGLRLIAGYAALLCLPALYLTESRSGMIGLLVGLVVFAVAVAVRKGVKRFLLVLLVAPLLAGLVGFLAWKASPMIQQRVALALEGDIRLVIWKDSLPIALERPLLGSGLGSYRWMYPHYRNHLTVNADPEFVHNDFLQFWAEFGVVGLLLAGLVFAALAVRAVRVIRMDADPGDAVLMGGLLAVLAGSLAHAFFDFNLHIFANVHVLIFLACALMCAASGSASEPVRDVSGKHVRWAGGLVAILLFLVAIPYGRALVSYGYVQAAEKRVPLLEWDEAQRYYQKAIAWSPGNWKAHLGYAHLLRQRVFYARDPSLKVTWFQEAQQHYEASLAGNPWEADALYGLGGLFKKAGEQEKALDYLRKAVEMVPRHVFYLNELGLLLKSMGRHEEALAAYRESMAVEANPVAERNIRQLEAGMPASP